MYILDNFLLYFIIILFSFDCLFILLVDICTIVIYLLISDIEKNAFLFNI